MPTRTATLAALIAAVAATAALAATPSQTISERQAHYKTFGKSFKVIMEELKKPAPDVAAIRPAAHTIAELSPQIPTWFPAGSGPEAGIKTAALPAIWTKTPEFKEDAAKFAAAAHNLDLAAQSGDVAKIKTAAYAAGGACKSCHDSFRAKEQ